MPHALCMGELQYVQNFHRSDFSKHLFVLFCITLSDATLSIIIPFIKVYIATVDILFDSLYIDTHFNVIFEGTLLSVVRDLILQ